MIIDEFLGFIRGQGGSVEDIMNAKCTEGNIDGIEGSIMVYTYKLCVQVVANLVARCEKETLTNGVYEKNKWHYQLNQSPNINQSADVFWRQLIHQLFNDSGEALVVEVAGQYYVADSFHREERAFSDNIYRDIVVKGQKVRYQNYFLERDVYYFTLDNFLGYVAADAGSFYNHILNVVSTQYLKKKFNKTIFEVPGISPINGKAGDSQKLKVLQEQVSEFFHKDSDSALVTDGNIQVGKYESVMGEGYNDDAPNILTLTNHTAQLIAQMFNLPTAALMGAEVSLSTHINLFLRPLLDIIETEINRKHYTRVEFQNGNKVKIKTTNIEKTSAIENAKANDYRLRSGIYSINEIRQSEGEEPIPEDWAEAHFMTLNYDIIDKFINGTQGSGNKNSPTQGQDKKEVEDEKRDSN